MSDIQFEKENIFERRQMAIEELVKYYAELRKYNYHNGEKLKGIEIRKKIHVLCDSIIKIDQLFSFQCYLSRRSLECYS